MVQRVLFIGGRLDSLVEVTPGGGETSSTTGRDTAYTDASINYPTQTNASHRATFRDASMAALTVSANTIWAHVEIAVTTNYTSGRNMLELCDASDNPWIAVRSASTTTLGFYYNSNTAASPTWTLIGSTFAHPSGTTVAYDIQFTFGSPHSATLYANGAPIATGTFTQALITGLRSFLTRGIATTTGTFYTRCSQYLVTEDISTVGAKVKYMRGTGAGSNSGWTGAVTDVNEVITDDATLNSAATAGLKQTYNMTDVTVPSGYEVKSVFHWVRARNTGVAPNNIKSVCRSGGADYSSANLVVGTGVAPTGMRYDLDPATSAQWTAAGLDAVEFGFESAT